MVSLDDATRQALEALCAKYAVRRLKIFGSAARADFDAERSDLDFLVEFGPPPAGMRFGVQFFGLHEELEGLFDRPVDLLEESAIGASTTSPRKTAAEVKAYVKGEAEDYIAEQGWNLCPHGAHFLVAPPATYRPSPRFAIVYEHLVADAETYGNLDASYGFMYPTSGDTEAVAAWNDYY